MLDIRILDLRYCNVECNVECGVERDVKCDRSDLTASMAFYFI
jgi:hypothetical protein